MKVRFNLAQLAWLQIADLSIPRTSHVAIEYRHAIAFDLISHDRPFSRRSDQQGILNLILLWQHTLVHKHIRRLPFVCEEVL